jgi:hypothetical protein
MNFNLKSPMIEVAAFLADFQSKVEPPLKDGIPFVPLIVIRFHFSFVFIHHIKLGRTSGLKGFPEIIFR